MRTHSASGHDSKKDTFRLPVGWIDVNVLRKYSVTICTQAKLQNFKR